MGVSEKKLWWTYLPVQMSLFVARWRNAVKTWPGQVEEGEADVERADMIAKDIGDHQLADEAPRWAPGGDFTKR